MRELNFRTGPKKPVQEPRLKASPMPEPMQSGPRCFFVRRCPWTGYYYAKGPRGSRSNGLWQRSIRGMKWNFYMKNGQRLMAGMRNPLSRSLSGASGSAFAAGIMSNLAPGRTRMRIMSPLREDIVTGHRLGSLVLGAEGSSKKKATPSGSAMDTKQEAAKAGMDVASGTLSRWAIMPGTSRRLSDQCTDTTWFPGITPVRSLPDGFVKGVRGRNDRAAAKTTIVSYARTERATRKERAHASGMAAQNDNDIRPARRRAAPKSGSEKHAIPKASGEQTGRSRRGQMAERPAGRPDAQWTRPAPRDCERKASGITMAAERMPRGEHRPTVSSVEKKVFQLKVAVGSAAVPPKR